MKKISSLPKGCELNRNVTIYTHTALKLDKPTLIITENDNLQEIVHYISFSKCMVDGDMNDVGKIVYYDAFGNSFFSDYYYHKDMKYVFRIRFAQIQDGIVHITRY